MFIIEKNVPITSKLSYPFDKMEPGDSFVVQGDVKKIAQVRQQLQAVKISNKNLKIASRLEEKGVRIWLLAK